MDDSSFHFQPRSERIASLKERPGKSKKIMAIVATVIVIILLGLGTSRILKGESKKKTAIVSPTPVETQTPTPSETPALSGTPKPSPSVSPSVKPSISPIDKASGLDRSKLSIHVLNGSGISGASKTASDFLESLGYNIIQIGNAANFNYEKIQIQVKSAKKDFLSLLKKDLEGKYTIGSASADLSTSERPDAFVIVGKQ